jgi:hypothetical protein
MSTLFYTCTPTAPSTIAHRKGTFLAPSKNIYKGRCYNNGVALTEFAQLDEL